MNKYIAKGNVTFDPELRRISSGEAVVDFTLAINKRWKDRSGEQKESVIFPRFNVWGASGESFAQHVKKGDAVLVDAEYVQDNWETPEGEKRTNHKFRVNSWEFAGTKKGEDVYDNGKQPAEKEEYTNVKDTPKAEAPKRGRPAKAPQPVVEDDSDSDIPF